MLGPRRKFPRPRRDPLQQDSLFHEDVSRGFAEANTKSAHLPEDNPDLFDVLLGWVHQDTIRPLTLNYLSLPA
jgi:hypothetical protein